MKNVNTADFPGTATSHAGYIYYSGGCTLAVNNTYKVTDPGALNKYEYVSFTKVMKLDPVTDSWSSVFSVRPESKQSYTLYGAVPSSISLKISYKTCVRVGAPSPPHCAAAIDTVRRKE